MIPLNSFADFGKAIFVYSQRAIRGILVSVQLAFSWITR